MSPVLTFIAGLLPQLIKYFTKNAGLNTVTGAAGGSLLTLVLMAMQSGAYDQIISYLQQYGDKGMIAAAVFIALRAGVQGYKAIKG